MTGMPNVFERFPKDADSASVEMVGKETVEHVPVSLRNVYSSTRFMGGIKQRTSIMASICEKR